MARRGCVDDDQVVPPPAPYAELRALECGDLREHEELLDARRRRGQDRERARGEEPPAKSTETEQPVEKLLERAARVDAEDLEARHHLDGLGTRLRAAEQVPHAPVRRELDHEHPPPPAEREERDRGRGHRLPDTTLSRDEE